MNINIIGAGLAGSEAAWQLAKRGIKVNLLEMKPKKFSPAHKNSNFAELVCSNSLKAKRKESAAGLLKEEMRKFDSLLLKCAEVAQVPAGGALAVDRDKFSSLVTDFLKNNKFINIINEEITEIPTNAINIVASGPLTTPELSEKIKQICKQQLSFFDAAAPIITAESIDMDHAFLASRYDKGDPSDYINCSLTKEEYEDFYNELLNAQRAPLHDFDMRDPKVYEGCLPIEVMAQRGSQTLRFGPMKPVGLFDPKLNARPWAVVQLRKENIQGSLYNLVGFQTNLKFAEQKRVFARIPALKNAEFIRFGVMHRNTFINSPKVLLADFSLKENPNIFFAGQITGVEGYMESAASGILAGINVFRRLNSQETLVLPEETMMGALFDYIANFSGKDFQPMGANFGILPAVEPHIKDKKLRYAAFAQRALNKLEPISEFIKS